MIEFLIITMIVLGGIALGPALGELFWYLLGKHYYK